MTRKALYDNKTGRAVNQNIYKTITPIQAKRLLSIWDKKPRE